MKLPLLRSAAILAAPLFAASAFAAQPEPQAGEATAEPEAEKSAQEGKDAAIVVPEVKEEKRICRRIATDMSSRRKERVCLTKEDWRELNQRR